MIHYSSVDLDIFEANKGTCGRDGQWCSNSCRELGKHVLIEPREGEMYGDTLARAKVERGS